MELLVTEAKSYMEMAPLTKLEAIANTMHSRVGCEKTDLRSVVLKSAAAENVHKSDVTNSATKLSLIMSQQKCEESTWLWLSYGNER